MVTSRSQSSVGSAPRSRRIWPSEREAVDAPRVEGAQEGRSVDEPLSEGEEAQEEAPSHVVLGHEQIPFDWPSPS